jgi:hypothetical protein
MTNESFTLDQMSEQKAIESIEIIRIQK